MADDKAASAAKEKLRAMRAKVHQTGRRRPEDSREFLVAALAIPDLPDDLKASMDAALAALPPEGA